ncbi:MAG TPA: glycine--tRNA ligase subunit beta, partial [Coxiellaceae bacterium]|nr:glycine--tRNA ligase subunit beta [Coxiellaceae bacterium]
GQKTADLLPELIEATLKKLVLGKTMRWGSYETEFVRPVQWIVLLFGQETINCKILGKTSERSTRGHRFHHPEAIKLEKSNQYVEELRQHKVIADFNERRDTIRKLIEKAPLQQAQALIDEELLTEVTGLVEWPTLHVGHFDRRFLDIPQEVLICSMKTHQKTFPMANKAGQLQAYFVVISNIDSKKPLAIVSGNERVINARLSDAEFFYQNDLKHKLEDYLPRLKALVFQKELGSIYDKTQRMSHNAEHIAKLINVDTDIAKRAALLAKCDLLSEMVKEFPELQGIMGYYYALHHHETDACAKAIREHYQPRFSGDAVAESEVGAVVALADKLDTLVGILGINKKPTGDKDPFALRRCALGIIRTLLEKEFSLDLMDLLKATAKSYKTKLANNEVVEESFAFIMERLKAWYAEQDISADVFEAVRSKNPTDLLDFAKRIKAVKEFQLLPEAASLAAANKRVNNILKKQTSKSAHKVHEELLQDKAELELWKKLHALQAKVNKAYEAKDYNETLCLLSTLKEPVDQFFEDIMIMADDKKLRDNRLALLEELNHLFGLVADLSVLQ